MILSNAFGGMLSSEHPLNLRWLNVTNLYHLLYHQNVTRNQPLRCGTRSFGGGWKPPQWRGCSQSRQHCDNLRAKSQGTIRYHPVMGSRTWPEPVTVRTRVSRNWVKTENEHPFPGRLLPKRRFYLGSCHLGPGQRITFVIFQRSLILNGLYSK